MPCLQTLVRDYLLVRDKFHALGLLGKRWQWVSSSSAMRLRCRPKDLLASAPRRSSAAANPSMCTACVAEFA